LPSTVHTYKEKMKELSMLSLICSCFYTQPHPNTKYNFGDMEVKPINKRTSGQAFEVVLKPPSTDLTHDQPLSPKKKELSLEELQNQLEAAEDRRKSQEAQLLQQLAEKQHHRRIVLHRAIVDNCDFSRITERKLNQKMETCKENRNAHIAAVKERLREKELHAAKVRRNKELREELSG
uniref:Stathmin n=1 Tax=Callorhinchus milii TaxID=7868 RepID=A0A4W3ISR0_CALMI